MPGVLHAQCCGQAFSHQLCDQGRPPRMWSQLAYPCAQLLLSLLEMCQEFRCLSTYMIVHSMVVQEWLNSLFPGGEDVTGLRDDVGLLDGNDLVFALPMLMLLLSDARDALAKPLPQDLDMLLPDVDISW